jgi:POT family proton-dependent oligopeptide transporter
LNLFALRNVDPSFDLFGLHLWNWKPAQFQSFNPIWIMLLSPILALMYTRAGKSGKDLSIAAKFALGFAVVALGFFIYSAAGHFTTQPGKTSSWIMVWGYGSSSLGELLVSGLGLAMIARYVPARMGGFMMGAYYVASGVSQYLGGVVANYASVPQDVTDPLKTMPIYTNLFFWLGVAGVVCTLIALSVLPLMKKLSAQHKAHNAAFAAPLPTIASEQ